MKELTDKEFYETFGEKMEQIDFDSSLLEFKIPDTIELTTSRRAYKSIDNPFEHHLVETSSKSGSDLIDVTTKNYRAIKKTMEDKRRVVVRFDISRPTRSMLDLHP